MSEKSSQITVANQAPEKAVASAEPADHLPQVQDVEAQRDKTSPSSSINDVRLSLMDINPFPPLWKVLQRKNNLTILSASGE